MKKFSISTTLVFLAIVLVSPPASAKVDLGPDGPFKVGVRIEYVDLMGRKAPVMVWYPAKPAAAAAYDYLGQTSGVAIKDAPPDNSGAPYPFILFSHGMGGCGQQSVFYTENLASHGYVVAAPDHLDAAMCHIDRPPDITIGKIAGAAIKAGFKLSGTVRGLFYEKIKELNYDFSYRPAEGKAVIDNVLQWNEGDTFYKGMIDPARIGVSGHSLGGYTSLMMGGVPFLCDQPEDLNPPPGSCDFSRADLDRLPNPCCIEKVRGSDPFINRDSRVKAMLPLGPAIFFPHLDRAAREIRVPFLIISGDNQDMEVPWAPIQLLYDNAPAPKYIIRLIKTDHMTITDVAYNQKIMRPILPGFRGHFQEKADAYKDYSVEFFNLYLKGEGDRDQGLMTKPNKFVELWATPK